MSDDLSNLAPNDPSSVDPDWSDRRQRILDGVLTTDAHRRSQSWRWVAGVAAIALVAVAVGGVVQQLRPEPYATPASPTPTVSAVNGGQVVAALDTLLDTGTGLTLCNGHVMESRPPQCPFTTPVTGIAWEDVPWAETAAGITFSEDTIVVGTFDDDTFVATQVFRADDPAAPQPPDTITDEDLPTLCETPTRGTGPDSIEALIVAAEALPGYQALWVSPNQVTNNVAVTDDVEGARSALAEIFGGELCVGTVDGPTDQALQDAELALEPLKLDVDSATTTTGSVWGTFSSVSTRGNRLEVSVARDTPELLDQIQSAVGDDVWLYTDIIPFFYPVEVSPTTDPTSSASSTTEAIAHGDPVGLSGTLLEIEGTMGICYANSRSAGQSDPPRISPLVCEAGFVPVTGIAMPGFDDRSGAVVGTFDGSVFHATRWYGEDEPLLYDSVPKWTFPPEPADICEAQAGTGAPREHEWLDLEVAAEELPGFQGWWPAGDASADSYRIAVTHGAEAAQKSLLEKFSVPLCVGTVPGPDAATLATGEKAVGTLFPRGPGELEPYVLAGVGADAAGSHLTVTLLHATEEIRTSLEEAVGPEIWPWTRIDSRLFPVEGAALESRAATPTPMPSGPTKPLAITDEDRQWAEESVATDLTDADGTSAAAMMAKATFEQYEALWSIDWEHNLVTPVVPPEGATEVLVVTLSAPLSLQLSGDALDAPPTRATGTMNVIDADTGKSILHVDLSGGSPSDRLTELPGPVEDVALPEGFR